jgi:hypothetical protein
MRLFPSTVITLFQLFSNWYGVACWVGARLRLVRDMGQSWVELSWSEFIKTTLPDNLFWTLVGFLLETHLGSAGRGL